MGLLARRPEELRYGGRRSRGGRAAPLRMGIGGAAQASPWGRETGAAVSGVRSGRGGRAYGRDGVVTVHGAAPERPGDAERTSPEGGRLGRRRGRSAFLTGEIGSNGTLSGPRRGLRPPVPCRLGPGRAAGRCPPPSRAEIADTGRHRRGQPCGLGGEACERGSSGTPPPGCSLPSPRVRPPL